jgi:hypothetical protein
MRTTALLLLIALTACASNTPEAPVFIADFTARSTAVECEPIPSLTARGGEIQDVTMASDSTFLILYDREVALVGPDLEPRHLIPLDTAGPSGLQMPSGVALLGDSLLYIADKIQTKLEVLDLQGRGRGTIHLDFAPQHLQRVGDQLLITPFVISNHPRSLLFTLEGEQVRSLPVATARYQDGLVNIFANTAYVASYPDGRIILTRNLIIPFAEELTLEAPVATRIPLPLPDGMQDRYGWLPTSRVTEADANNFLFATLAAAPDQRTGDLIYLTKTGRANEQGNEKALIRVDSKLRFLRSYLLDRNAVQLAYLSEQNLSLIATTEDEWFSCSTP